MKSATIVLAFVSMLCLAPLSVSAAETSKDAKGGTTMHTYMILFGFTQQGIQNIKQSPARVESAKQAVKSMGGTVKAFYGILGFQYDTVFIIEAPDDEVVAKMILSIASQGNVRTDTHRLFTETEYDKIISALP